MNMFPVFYDNSSSKLDSFLIILHYKMTERKFRIAFFQKCRNHLRHNVLQNSMVKVQNCNRTYSFEQQVRVHFKKLPVTLIPAGSKATPKWWRTPRWKVEDTEEIVKAVESAETERNTARRRNVTCADTGVAATRGTCVVHWRLATATPRQPLPLQMELVLSGSWCSLNLYSPGPSIHHLRVVWLKRKLVIVGDR